eukprot:scaffold27960_cov39-Tisochrysis_lutea.AAC.1
MGEPHVYYDVAYPQPSPSDLDLDLRTPLKWQMGKWGNAYDGPASLGAWALPTTPARVLAERHAQDT